MSSHLIKTKRGKWTSRANCSNSQTDHGIFIQGHPFEWNRPMESTVTADTWAVHQGLIPAQPAHRPCLMTEFQLTDLLPKPSRRILRLSMKQQVLLGWDACIGKGVPSGPPS